MSDMDTDGVSTDALPDGSTTVSSDGTDDFGLASGPENLPENESFGVAILYQSSDDRGGKDLFGVLTGNGRFLLSDFNFQDGTLGELFLQLQDTNGNQIQVETQDRFIEGDVNLLVINKNSDDASDINFYVNDMTTPVPKTVHQNPPFDSSNYSVSEAMGFFARNEGSQIREFRDMEASFFEFAQDPYSAAQRRQLKRRISAVPSVPDTAVTSGLVAWYRFDGDTARDYTAFVDDPSITNTTAFDGEVDGATFQSDAGVRDVVSGANPSGAYGFDGNDIVSSPNELNEVFESSFSIGSWVNTDSTTQQAVLSFNNDFDKWFAFEIGFGPFLRISVDDNTGDRFSLGASGSTNEDRHMFLSYDAQNDTASIYIDGQLIGSRNIGQPYESDDEFYIGAFFPSDGRKLDGIVDDVRIYNRALSDSEINQIYNNTEP
jgi:hypothetical protein